MTEAVANDTRPPVARRFEYLGWALFLVGAGVVGLADVPGDRALYALIGGAAMALYILAGWLLKYRVTGGLVFLAAVLLAWGAADYFDLGASLFPILLLAGGAVLALKAIRGDKA